MWIYFLAISVSLFHLHIKNVAKCSVIQNELPLLLTPYIERNEMETARSLALVTGLTPNITSYSGFFTIDKECDSNLFFWFFPSQRNWEKDPVSVWLNGGPGISSLVGLFHENGPYTLTPNGTLILNEYSWNRNSSIIYIDNPVGTGFSFTSNNCFATNQEQIGEGILNALLQFFQLFPELRPNPFFLTGQSYAGKYIPATAHAILTSDQKSSFNFQGVAIGNGWIDPVNQLGFGDYLYQLGLIDQDVKEKMDSYEKIIPSCMEQGNYTLPCQSMDNVLDLFRNISGFSFLYNYLYEKEEPGQDIGTLVKNDEVKYAIHVGNLTYNGETSNVAKNLFEDDMKSVRPWLEEILDNDCKVLLFNGQLDIVVPYPTTLNFVQKLSWKGAEDYKKAKREIWYVEGEIAGFSKTAGKFTEVLVRNAGHLVPTDQPKWALDLYNRFIYNESLNNSK